MYTKSNKEVYRFKVFQEIEEEKEFDVEREFDVEKEIEVEKTRKTEDGKEEKYKDKEKRMVKEKRIVKEMRKNLSKKEHVFVITQPTRRQMEEADLEYSVEMSKCVKEGILTKAMLLNKYSDTGGLLSESDAKKLSKLYGELGELQTEFTALNIKNPSKANEEKRKKVSEEMATLRRTIANAETTFSALLNHTADVRAQNKVIVWYLLSLTKIEVDGKLKPFFDGETFEEKKADFYEREENEEELLSIVYDKLMTFVSFWYFSAAATSEDFEQLEQDLEEGNL
jgi:hypothetical protein